ncbi:MAG: energy-coupled thiamine transporter ThiT [Clostridia bacterium]
MTTILFKPLSTLEPDKQAAAIFIYIAFALIVAIAAVLITLAVKKSDKLKKAAKICGIISLGYAIIVCAVMMYMTIKTDGFEGEIAFPILAVIAAIIAAAIAIVVAHNRFPTKQKIVSIIGVSVVAVATLVAAILLYNYYIKNIVDGGYYDIKQVELIIAALVMISIPIVIMFVFDKQKMNESTRSIVFGAVCVAMSMALSYLKFVKMPQGGSITFASLVPLMIYSMMFGVKKGVLTCFAYGILQAFQDPYIVHPMQFLLDYPIAFSFIGLTGLFTNIKKISNKPALCFILGGTLASVLRFFSHVLSGVFAFSVYAPEGISPWIYSIGYNSFVFADILIALVVGGLILISKRFIFVMNSYAQNKI